MNPPEFFEQVVEAYWEKMDEAGRRLEGAYSEAVIVPDNQVLPLPGNVSLAVASKQINVYLYEMIGIFLRKQGKTFVFLDWDERIGRARWIETKEPPEPASLMNEYFDGLHRSPAFISRWADGRGGGLPPVTRVNASGETFLDPPLFSEFLSTFNISWTNIPYSRPGKRELGPTISPSQVIYHDCMHDIVTGEELPIPTVLASRDKVAGCPFNPDPNWYEEGKSTFDGLMEDMQMWQGLFDGWLVGRVGHSEPSVENPETARSRLARSLLGALYRLPGDDSFPYIYGPGGTGKSLLQNSFSNMAGEYSTEVTRAALTKGANANHSSNSVSLYLGARCAIVKEARNDRGEMDSELIKDITSYEPGRTYSVRAAYDTQPREYESAAKPFFVSNDSPYHLLESEGMGRRLVAFPFLSKYVESGQADRGLPERLVSVRMRCALIQYLMTFRDKFLNEGSVPDPEDNKSEGQLGLLEIFMDCFKYHPFATKDARPPDSVNNKDLLEMRAYLMGFPSVDEMLYEQGLTRNKATRQNIAAVKDLVSCPDGGARVESGKSRGSMRVLLNVVLTEKGLAIYGEARAALSSD